MSARTLPAAVLGAALALGLAPAPAAAADTAACTVTAAELTWAVDTAIRADAGDWEAAGEVAHNGSAFSWTAGTGVADATLPSASVVFDGAVTFPTVDGGRLAAIADPTLVVDGEQGRLLLAPVAEDGADAAGGDQLHFLDVDLAAATVTKDGGVITLTVVGAPTTLTEEGASRLTAHAAGDDFESIDATIVADCAAPDAEASPDETEQGTLWLPVGAVALGAVLVALLAGGSVARRKRRTAALAPAPAEEPEDPAS